MKTATTLLVRHMIPVIMLVIIQGIFTSVSAGARSFYTVDARQQQKGFMITITGDNVIGRDGPNGVDLGLRFNKGARLRCVGSSGSWYQCRVNNRYVWVSSRYATRNAGTVQKQPVTYVVITGDRVVGRTTPGGADSGKRFYKGQRLKCVGESGSWFKVRTAEKTYWVSAQYAYLDN